MSNENAEFKKTQFAFSVNFSNTPVFFLFHLLSIITTKATKNCPYVTQSRSLHIYIYTTFTFPTGHLPPTPGPSYHKGKSPGTLTQPICLKLTAVFIILGSSCELTFENLRYAFGDFKNRRTFSRVKVLGLHSGLRDQTWRRELMD